MLNNLVNRLESRRAMRVTKNFKSHELTVLGRLLLEGAREIEVANVILFPSIDKGFSVFSIETGASLGRAQAAAAGEEGEPAPAKEEPSTLPKLAVGLVNELKNDAYHLVVRQGESLTNGIVLASFPTAKSASMGLRTLTKQNANKASIWKIMAFIVLAYLLITLPFKMMRPPKINDVGSIESRNPELARQLEDNNRARTVGSELLEHPVPTQPTQPDPRTMLGSNAGQISEATAQSTPMPVPQAAAPVPVPPAPQTPAKPTGDFGFGAK